MTLYELTKYPEAADIDLRQCQTCKHKDYDFECGEIGYCITDCGEGYVVGSILMDKGYGQVNIDFAYDEESRMIPSIELTIWDAKKLISGLEKLGHTCSTYHHPLQKRYLIDVIVDNGVKPITLARELLKLEAIK